MDQFKPHSHHEGVAGLFVSDTAETQYIVLAPNSKALRRVVTRIMGYTNSEYTLKKTNHVKLAKTKQTKITKI